MYTYFLHAQGYFKRNTGFPLPCTCNLFGHSLAQESLSQGNKSYNFCRPSLVCHYYNSQFVWSMHLCPGVEKNIFMEIMHFQYVTYITSPQHKNLCTGGHKSLVDLPFFIIAIFSVCLVKIKSRKEDFFLKKYSNFTMFFKHKYNWVRFMEFTILLYKSNILNLVKISQVVLEKRC